MESSRVDARADAVAVRFNTGLIEEAHSEELRQEAIAHIDERPPVAARLGVSP